MTAQSCLVYKQVRKAVGKGPVKRATQPMEKIHSDICGPIRPSLSKKEYFVTFINDYSQFAVVYPITHKSEALEKLQEFLHDNRSVGTCRELHTDNGGEYLSNNMANFLLEHGSYD